jgi:hypothetical protein
LTLLEVEADMNYRGSRLTPSGVEVIVVGLVDNYGGSGNAVLLHQTDFLTAVLKEEEN